MYGSAAQVRGRSKHLGHVGTAQAAGRAHGVALHGRDGGTLAPPASNEPNESNKQIKQTNQTNQTNDRSEPSQMINRLYFKYSTCTVTVTSVERVALIAQQASSPGYVRDTVAK